MDPSPSSAAPPAADPTLGQLFAAIENRFQTTSLGEERWYVLAIACLATGPDPESASQLYLHLIGQSRYSTSTARQALVRRLREALLKSVCVIGVCKPIEAILAISQVEREEDRDYTCTRDNCKPLPAPQPCLGQAKRIRQPPGETTGINPVRCRAV